MRFLDERVRIHFALKDADRNDISTEEIISDCYFNDKLFKIVPEQKFSFYEELREMEKAYQRLVLAGTKGEKMKR